MLVAPARGAFAALAILALCGAGCGARTGIFSGEAAADAPSDCLVDDDCATGDACAPASCVDGTCHALPAKRCDDGDDCTRDRCLAPTGQCMSEPLTPDRDGDGHRSPKPGFLPGAPGACGDDCDDGSAAAYPAGTETCDGVDNDCDGKVDEGASYGGVSTNVRISSRAFDRASAAALAFDGRNYGVTYTGHTTLESSYFHGIARNGATVVAETPLTDINSETYASALLYNGSFFERTWEDARQGQNYEVYFNRFDSNGKKLGPDLRVTNAPGFSLGSTLVWNGSESLLVWDDRRFEDGSGPDVRLFGQRVSFDGALVGENVQLTRAGLQAEHPGLALGRQRVGIVFSSQLTAAVRHAVYFSTAQDFTDVSSLVDLGGADVQNTNLVRVGDRFLVAWEENKSGTGYGPSIVAAVVGEGGQIFHPAQAVTSRAKIARSFSLLSLGDRVLVIWSDDFDGNFDLYWEILGPDLETLSPRTRLTATASDTFFPYAAFGPNGDVGVVYQDYESNFSQVYFLGMACVMSSSPIP